jgi:hypothetical protein
MAMKLTNAISVLAVCLAIAACGSEPDPNAKEVDEFAARIRSGAKPAKDLAATPAPSQTHTPSSDQKSPVGETASETGASNCAAPKVAPFFGRQADDATRAAVMAAVAPQTNVRFIEVGPGVIEDTESPRLNVMVDVTGVIREARCG